MDGNQTEKSSGLRTPEVSRRSWEMFYPGIENNMIFVHGTPTAEKRDQIITSGLKPPNEAVSSDTLARNVQFCTFERYSGFDGYILVYSLEETDMKDGTQFLNKARTFSIGQSRVINQDKIVVIIPKTQSLIFDQIQQDYRVAIEESETDTGLALDRIGEISSVYVGKISGHLGEHGKFLKGKLSEVQLGKLSQELVWNQLADNVKCTVQNLDFYSRKLQECGPEGFIGFEKMIQSLPGWESKSWEYVRRSIAIVKALENQKGSGLDKIHLTERINMQIVEDFIDWKLEKEKLKLEEQMEAKRLADKSKLQQLLYKLTHRKNKTER